MHGNGFTRSVDRKLWDWDLTTQQIHFSSAWISMVGEDENDFSDSPEEWFNRIHPEDLELVKSELQAQLKKGSSQFEIQHRLLQGDTCYRWKLCQGAIKRDEKGQAIRISGCHVDVGSDNEINPVTGLPNRVRFLDQLTTSIETARQNEDLHFAVLTVDLYLLESGVNRLETINSNSLIIAAARRMETSLKEMSGGTRHGRSHLIAHSGGEEFIILLDGLSDINEARLTAEHLMKAILAPFEFEGREVFLSPSIGIALSGTGYCSAEDVLRDAATALYRAKTFGKARCEVFDIAIIESAQTRHQLAMDLQLSLSHQELQVFYQPILCLASNQIAGLEALVRWKHPTRGLIAPPDFIQVAERTGFIIPLDLWVMQHACKQLTEWKQKPGISNDLWISTNLSGEQLMRPSLAKDAIGILQETGLDAHNLILELTEADALKNIETTRRLLTQLRVMGVRIALDDFGAGYASLSQLQRLPLDFLKIDYFFVRNVENNPDTREIIRAITSMALQLKLQVVAEGIENSHQRDLLQSLDCKYGQGFLFSKAVIGDQAEALLHNNRSGAQL